MLPKALTQNAIHLLQQCATENGFLASPNQVDNYQRIWSRDSAMAGIAGLLHQNKPLIKAWIDSVRSLGQNQSEWGQIPSNLAFNQNQIQASYGTLSGKVDATTWWIISASICSQLPEAHPFAELWQLQIDKAFKLLKAWQFNGRGLLYTPLGGNWADEYVYSGYLLYDQALYYWALRSAGQAFNQPVYLKEAEALKELIEANFNPKNESDNKYHPMAFKRVDKSQTYWFSGFAPNAYQTRWDMPANALALLLNLNTQSESITQYLESLKTQLGHSYLPVFWPPILEQDADWALLASNHLYAFKNQAGYFHNGGSWPVFLGWLCLALAVANETNWSAHLHQSLYQALANESEALHFPEYFNLINLGPGGVNPLAFTASGWLLADRAQTLETPYDLKILLF